MIQVSTRLVFNLTQSYLQFFFVIAGRKNILFKFDEFESVNQQKAKWVMKILTKTTKKIVIINLSAF